VKTSQEIDDILKIDQPETDSYKFDPSNPNTLFEYIQFVIMPFIHLIDEKQNDLFTALPYDVDEFFLHLKSCLLKLASMEDDMDYNYWFNLTNDIYNSFLRDTQISEDKKRKLLVHGLDIDNVMNEISNFVKYNEKRRKQNQSFFDMMWITQEAYDKKLSSLKEQQGLLQIDLKEHTNGNYEFLTTVGVVFSLAKRARERFDSSEI
jgi:hypothetical protein